MESRIIGGQESWAHSWPWQVSLQFATMPACGGAIISPLWVLSAAHCFKRYQCGAPNDTFRLFKVPDWSRQALMDHLAFRYNKAAFWTVLAGKHDLDNLHEAGQQVPPTTDMSQSCLAVQNLWERFLWPHLQVVGVSGIINHHHYNTRTKENDLSLLKLQQPLLFNHLVRPIDIWTGPLPSSSMCTITGWGSTRESEFKLLSAQRGSTETEPGLTFGSTDGPRVNRLQEVNVTVLPPETCDQYYLGRIRPSMFCAGRDQGGVDACQV